MSYRVLLLLLPTVQWQSADDKSCDRSDFYFGLNLTYP
ncbi:hypothetical protein PANI_CDS0006 [Maribacter phage Panino]